MAVFMRHFVFSITAIFVLSQEPSIYYNVSEEYFVKVSLLNASENAGIPISEFQARSNVMCANKCRRSEMCAAYGYSTSHRHCRLFDEEFEIEHPDKRYDDEVFYGNYCQHGGSKIGEYCICVNGFNGQQCEQYPTDCDEVDPDTNGTYYIKPINAPKPFKVRCVKDSNGIKLSMQKHTKYSFSFNRSWTDFKNGFGTLHGDHWLGNNKLYWLTSGTDSYALEVVIDFVNITSKKWFYFREFQVGSDYSLMILPVQGASGLTDCLSQYNGMEFSTYDHLPVVTISNASCAIVNGSGWWYDKFCSTCNLNGRLYDPKDNITVGRAVWHTNTTVGRRIRSTEMFLVKASGMLTGSTIMEQPPSISTPFPSISK